MNAWPPKRITVNIVLGALALILGLGAIVVGRTPTSGRRPMDTKRLAELIEREMDHVTAQELSGWIREKKAGLRIIDLRDQEDYEAYHLPGAEQRDLHSLMDERFDDSETVVLYSGGGIHAAQGVFLLWADGYTNIFSLKGGISSWREEIDSTITRHSVRTDTSANRPPVLKRTPPQRERERLPGEC